MRTDAVTRVSQRGISLIELILFIVIVSVGLVGILSVMTVTSKSSANPILLKQATAIAESLLEEIQLQPFTFCAPEDNNATTATGAVAPPATIGCADPQNSEDQLPLGTEATVHGKTRYGDGSGAKRFNNVSHYNAFPGFPSGITDINNTPVGLESYNATVSVSRANGSTIFAGPAIPDADVLKIDVRVTQGTAVDVTLTGYRFRYAPNVGP
ncbi:MAG: type secretion system protein [Herminiimonas sp.]|nr:type secretion system protein [Herminiimonas sp.]